MSQDEPRIRVRIVVSGRVQGVFFRASARDQAERLGIGGFARNQPDGSVLIEAEGPSGAVERFREWCTIGPTRANVQDIDVTPIAIRGEREFTVG